LTDTFVLTFQTKNEPLLDFLLWPQLNQPILLSLLSLLTRSVVGVALTVEDVDVEAEAVRSPVTLILTLKSKPFSKKGQIFRPIFHLYSTFKCNFPLSKYPFWLSNYECLL